MNTSSLLARLLASAAACLLIFFPSVRNGSANRRRLLRATGVVMLAIVVIGFGIDLLPSLANRQFFLNHVRSTLVGVATGLVLALALIRELFPPRNQRGPSP